MFQIGEVVVYGSTGVCTVEDIAVMSLPRAGGGKQEYYILRPISVPTCKTYVPTSNMELAARIRPVSTAEQIDWMIESVRGERLEWIADTRRRMDTFGQIVSEGVTTELLKLIGCLYLEKKARTEAGKKFCLTDEKLLRAAERIVDEEFAYVLGIPKTEVSAYIAEKIK